MIMQASGKIILGITKYLLPTALLLSLLSCSKGTEESFISDPGSGVYENVAPANAVRGHIRVKFQEDPTATKAGVKTVDLSSLGTYSIIRSFPDAGRFEARHRRYGLHLWYEVFFDESLPLTRALNALKGTDGLDCVEYVKPVKLLSGFTFNDPEFGKQWHYSNPGTISLSVAGSDINLLPAWEKTTGSPEVIVAICDGGVDWTHPDLSANMWVNEVELNGLPGIDDDGNGFIDDIYGYNFIVGPDGNTPVGALEAENHGTHVGGTVAAVNNNGIGVCGIAGGDGSSGSGVRLMSTQTSESSGTALAYIAYAFVYAADNGACLINCSWSLGEYEQYISDAIDYFNGCAGMDENGNQTGPMAGGLAIFAAGNDADTDEYPAQQDNVFAVASIGADYQAAYYTNYGSWVDITAPGGDANKGAYVYSTLPGGKYGTMQGTSMACPHVTGVAALVVSQFGGPGFTRQNLIDILQGTSNRIIYEKNASKFRGMLGSGLVDAGAAVSASRETPSPVTDLTGEVSGNIIRLHWTVPEGDVLPFSFRLYYSDKPFEALTPAGNAVSLTVPCDGAAAGETISYMVQNLEFNTQYHFLIESVSSFGIASDRCSFSISTLGNSKPVVTPLDGTSLDLKSHETGRLRFSVSDIDGHTLSCHLSDKFSGASIRLDDNEVTLSIDALKLDDGKTYSGSLYVTDGYDTVETRISYNVRKNNTPTATGSLENIIFGALKESATIHLDECISDADGESLSYGYKILSGGGSTITGTFTGDELKLTAASYGTATVEVTAADARGASSNSVFSVIVRDGSLPADLYPNPVKDKLNVRTGTLQRGEVFISDKAGAVVLRSGKDIDLNPFAPLSFDMSGLPGGVYYVTIKSDAQNRTYSVIKQ